MRVRYRVMECNPSHSIYSVTWHHERIDSDGRVILRAVEVSGISQDIPIAAISTLELSRNDGRYIMDVSAMFNLLQLLPNLKDLTIDFEPRTLPTHHAAKLRALPFRLRRLVVSPVFLGAGNLLHGSGNTLEVLVLGPTVGGCHAAVLGDLSRFCNLRALRIETDSDARFIASASRRLTALAASMEGDLELAHDVHEQLIRLSVIYAEFDDDDACALAADLELFPALRTLEVEIDVDDDFTLTGGPHRQQLANVCRERRIRVSFMRGSRCWRLGEAGQGLIGHWGGRGGDSFRAAFRAHLFTYLVPLTCLYDDLSSLNVTFLFSETLARFPPVSRRPGVQRRSKAGPKGAPGEDPGVRDVIYGPIAWES